MRKSTTKSDTEDKNLELFELDTECGMKMTASFDAPRLSSLGGLALLRDHERGCGITERLASCIHDGRDQALVKHSMTEMIRQRIYQIAAGYPDADDSDRLRNDPVMKMCAGRTPDGSPLASQSTHSRLDATPTTAELYAMAESFVDEFIASYESAPAHIIIDADDTDSQTYGGQQLAMFNSYYHGYCYMPLLLFEGGSGKLILPVLRPGRANKGINIAGLLRRLITKIRRKWHDTVIMFRGDSHFCSHDFMDWAQGQRMVYFVTGLGGNSKLYAKAKEWAEADADLYRVTGEETKTFHTFMYKAESWGRHYRVIVKIETGKKGQNIRFIVTDIEKGSSEYMYTVAYCGRGRCEQMIRELKECMQADRMPCNKFKSNQFRLFLHCAAYVVVHSFRAERLAGTELAQATMLTIRERLLLSAVNVTVLRKTVKLRFQSGHPSQKEMTAALLCLHPLVA